MVHSLDKNVSFSGKYPEILQKKWPTEFLITTSIKKKALKILFYMKCVYAKCVL